jgi:hypothetical protein
LGPGVDVKKLFSFFITNAVARLSYTLFMDIFLQGNLTIASKQRSYAFVKTWFKKILLVGNILAYLATT